MPDYEKQRKYNKTHYERNRVERCRKAREAYYKKKQETSQWYYKNPLPPKKNLFYKKLKKTIFIFD